MLEKKKIILSCKYELVDRRHPPEIQLNTILKEKNIYK